MLASRSVKGTTLLRSSIAVAGYTRPSFQLSARNRRCPRLPISFTLLLNRPGQRHISSEVLPPDSENDISLDYTLPFQLTKKIHRDVYDQISPTNPSNSAKDQIILITGGGTGLGLAAAKVWLRAGAKGVIITSHRAEDVEKSSNALEDLRKELGAETKILATTGDLIEESHAEDIFARAKETFGRPPDVVMANAGFCPKPKPLHEGDVDDWWHGFEVNVKATHNTVRSFIRSQDKPESPVGTVIATSSGLVGLTPTGLSAYCTSKLAVHRYMEFLHKEYPSLCSFTLLPGLVPTAMMLGPEIKPYSKDQPEMVGCIALYLASKKADYLRGSLMSVNWDINELEEHKAVIKDKGLLQTKWIPILPCGGGKGLEEVAKESA